METNDGILWALIILIGLSACIPVLKIQRSLKTIEREKQAQERAEQLRTTQDNNRKMFLRESIQVLAKSMLDDQVELSEGCMRIKILMDHYDSDLHEDPKFSVFTTMYTHLEAHPRFEARKSVNKKFLTKLDDTRHKLELEYREDIKNASREIIAAVS